MLHEKITFSAGAPILAGLYYINDYPFHFHKDILEILMVLEGSFELTVVNNVITMAAGDIYIFSPNELHRLRAIDKQSCVALIMYINSDKYKTEFPDISTYQFANSAISANTAGMQILGDYLKKQLPFLFLPAREELPAYSFYKAGEEILQILVQYFQCYYIGNYYPEFNNVYRDNKIQLNRIRRIVDYIYSNYNKPIKIEDVANMEYISTNYLTHILKNGCGVGFRMFLNMARVEQSARLLLENTKSLQTIALDCGFSKLEYFNASFKKVFRMKPTQYWEKYHRFTIASSERRMPELCGDELEAFLKKLYAGSLEIRADLQAGHQAEQCMGSHCISVSGLQYNHISDFPVLKKLKEEILFHAIGMDTGFLRAYEKDQRALKIILSDFGALAVALRVYITCGESINDLKGDLEILKRICHDESSRKPEFILKVKKNEATSEKAKSIQALIAAYGFNVYTSARRPRSNENESTGLMYTLSHILSASADGASVDAQPPIPLYGLLGKIQDDPALLTEAGLITPVYSLLFLLKRMGNLTFTQGEMYYMTKNAASDDFQILLYNYDKDIRIREFKLSIDNITGKYILRKYRINPGEHAMKFSKPVVSCERLTAETIRVLNNTLDPKTSIHVIEPDGRYLTALQMDPFDIVLLTFEQI